MLTAVAPAKVNLLLHVLGQRADGYHALESLVAFTDFGDSVSVAVANDMRLEISGEFSDACGNSRENLVMRAAYMLQERSGYLGGAHIQLTKNIPVGAGLGGGSSDAATALLLLRALWQVAVPDAVLHAIASSLGADVTMCLHHRPLIATGRGDVITTLPCALPHFFMVLVYPRKVLSTPRVFSHYRADGAPPQAEDWQSFTHDQILPKLQRSKNHLQRAAISICPEVAEVLLALETCPQQPELVRMTGSGPCCFALFDEAARAESLLRDIRKRYPHWWVALSFLKD